jgi:hypothetical protein
MMSSRFERVSCATLAAVLALLLPPWARTQDAVGEPQSVGGGDGQVAEEATTAAPFRSELLAFDPQARPEEGLSLALHAASQGRLTAALEVLDTARRGASGALLIQLQTEHTRLQALLELRGAYLQRWLEDGERLELEFEGQSRQGRVTALSDESLTLEMSRGRTLVIPRDAVLPAPMAADLRRNARDLGEPLLRGYGLLLSSADAYLAEALKELRRGGAEGRELTRSAAAYREHLELGALLVGLAELEVEGAPTDLESALRVRDRLLALRRRPWQRAALASYDGALTRLARLALELMAQQEQRLPGVRIESAVDAEASDRSGSALAVGAGQVRATFEFDTDAGLAATFETLDVLVDERALFPDALKPVERPVQSRLGSLVLQGAVSLVSRLEFEGPVSLTYEMAYGTAEGAKNAHVRVGLIDALGVAYVSAAGSGALMVQDAQGRPRVEQRPASLEPGVRRSIELKLDGKQASAERKRRSARLPVKDFAGGRVFVWVHSDRPIDVSSLVVVGRLTAASRQGLERVWVDRELGRLMAGQMGAAEQDDAAGLGTAAGPAGRALSKLLNRRENSPHGPAVDRALNWLAAHQELSGFWSSNAFDEQCGKLGRDVICSGLGHPRHDVGVTSLALLAFLGQGHTDGWGAHATAVRRGLRYLATVQLPDGNFGDPAHLEHSYDHVLATLAMVEAYGLTGQATYADAAKRGIGYLYALRFPGQIGWRYGLPGHEHMKFRSEDTSVTAWCVVTLKKAQEVGLDVETRYLADAYTFLDEMTDSSGRTGYYDRGGGCARIDEEAGRNWSITLTESMTAAAVLCRIFVDPKLALPGNEAAIQQGLGLIQKLPIVWDDARPGRRDFYFWYYATYALYQWGGSAWRAWEPGLDQIAEHQVMEGEAAGSWDPRSDPWGSLGGRVYTTALLTLCLQVHHRYDTVMGAH